MHNLSSFLVSKSSSIDPKFADADMEVVLS